MDITYCEQRGELLAVHKRLSLDGHPRFIWRRGDHPPLYGLPYLNEIRKAGWIVLAEGDSDAWTLWFHRIPALGIPGSSTWKEHFASLLQGLRVYIWHEPDGGGDELIKAVITDLPDVRVIEAPADAKDVSELYLHNPKGFRARLEALLKAARPASEIRAEALSTEARECFKVAHPLLQDPKLLDKLSNTLGSLGYAGDTRPALMSYVAIASRLMEETSQPCLYLPVRQAKMPR